MQEGHFNHIGPKGKVLVMVVLSVLVKVLTSVMVNWLVDRLISGRIGEEACDLHDLWSWQSFVCDLSQRNRFFGVAGCLRVCRCNPTSKTIFAHYPT